MLKNVVAQFISSFQYLDSKGNRKALWYEFWYSDVTKERFTNTTLTKKIEQAAQECCNKLNALSTQYAEESFALHQEEFFNIIITALSTVQILRFDSGTIKTENYQQGQHHILKRSLHPKQEGLFETMLINGLTSVLKKYPALSPALEQKILIIKEARPEPFTLLLETMKIHQYGKFFSVDGEPKTINDVPQTVHEKLFSNNI
ncbi:hypothetical protein TUM19329_21260 [Legionella antarctica]|uniref:Uncharacterized protein n=1 Tax=Legionella antarctica TaxID=2708020 RepID=A0A6F8T4Z9_9GAMM|nr:hypothetical protein [Legionella antarctica]BCA95765.1 hypothetical protein TUM19329_21260 [Legionella antarctica]